MAEKDSLKVILVANNRLIAESTDPVLWQSVFSAINERKVLNTFCERQRKSEPSTDLSE